MFVLVWLIIDSQTNFSFCYSFEATETEITNMENIGKLLGIWSCRET